MNELLNQSLSEKNNEDENIINENNKHDIKDEYGTFVSEKGKSNKEGIKNCCKILLMILVSITVILIELVLLFISAIIFIYYKNKDQCEAKLYSKIKNILYIYLSMFIISIIAIIFKVIESFYKNKKEIMILVIYYNLLEIIIFILKMINLVIVQIYYNISKSWNHCGHFKNWTIFWLVVTYISIIFNVLEKIFSLNKKN